MRTSCLLLACTLALAAAASANPGDTAYPTLEPLTCYASAVAGDTLFLGGDTRWVGLLSGGGVPVHPVDLTPLPGFPHVNGEVLAATTDGAGGWFIGGTFTNVGGAAHANLAHVLANMSVEAWAPSTNGSVLAIAASASEVYVAGTFTVVNGLGPTGFAGVNRATGATIYMGPAPNAIVQTLATDGTTLYIGGEFTSIGIQSRGRMAAYRVSDHALLPWNPAAGPSGGVYSLRIANGLVYAGGNFYTIQGLSRPGAAALDPITAIPRPWAPTASAYNYGVRAILPVGDRVYLGGDFSQVGGVARHSLAAVDTATGALLAWDPNVAYSPGVQASPSVSGLEVVGSDILASGSFDLVGGLFRANLVRLDSGTGVPLPSTPEVADEARTLSTSGANVYVGGRFSGFGFSRRLCLLAIRASTGELLAWAPSAARDENSLSFVEALALDDTTVYASTTFNDGFGPDRSWVVAWSRATGAARWSFEPYGRVYSLARLDSRLILGGDFFFPSSTGLIALDASSGASVAWGGSTTGAVRSLLPTPSGLVVGGDFTSAGGQPRNRLALLDPSSGLATGWNPDVNGSVRALERVDTTLYLGGDFTTAGGVSRSRLAAVSTTSGLPTAWAPAANAIVLALRADLGIVYAGGGFATLGGQPRSGLAAVSAQDASVMNWTVDLTGGAVRTLQAAAGRVFAGGSQTATGPEPTRALTVVQAPPSPLLAVPGSGGSAVRLALSVEPQPARSAARLHIRLANAGKVEIGLYDPAGRRVGLGPPARHYAAGEFTVPLETRRLRPGLYLVRVSTREARAEGKLVVLP